jgi:hypothetical protein
MLLSVLSVLLILFLNGSLDSPQEKTAFIEKLAPSAKNGGFQMEDYWVWGASVIQGEDGKYHMFASRWPKKYPFFAGYIFN